MKVHRYHSFSSFLVRSSLRCSGWPIMALSHRLAASANNHDCHGRVPCGVLPNQKPAMRVCGNLRRSIFE